MRYVLATIVLVACSSRSTPAILDLLPIDENLALVARDRAIERVDRAGSPRWHVELPARFVRFARADRTALVRTENELMAIDADNGKIAWTQHFDGAIGTRDIVVGNYVVTVAGRELRSTDVRTGGIVWTKSVDVTRIDPATGGACVMEGFCANLVDVPPHPMIVGRTRWTWPPVLGIEII
jgi:outer membrane protein assembly factor BamB